MPSLGFCRACVVDTVPVEAVVGAVLGNVGLGPAVGLRGVIGGVLYVDDQQRCLVRHDGTVLDAFLADPLFA
ncbi:MAG: hypothetical protein QOG25_2861 [Acetobacteraceae bacterium]|nr:hypothetical protein [Acetobacteraceae bacterium]